MYVGWAEPESGGAPPPSLSSALAAFLIAAEGIAALRSTPLKDRFLPSSAPSDSAKRKDCSSLCCCAARAAAPSSPWQSLHVAWPPFRPFLAWLPVNRSEPSRSLQTLQAI